MRRSEEELRRSEEELRIARKIDGYIFNFKKIFN